MVNELVLDVLRDNSHRHVSVADPSAAQQVVKKLQAKADAKDAADAPTEKDAKPRRRVIRAGSICPECGIGKVIKGNTAYGCSRWKEGCNWLQTFQMNWNFQKSYQRKRTRSFYPRG